MRVDRSTLRRGALFAFAAIALYYLAAEHRAHTFGALPHILLGLCVVLLYLASGSAQGEATDTVAQPPREHKDPD